MVAVVRVNLLDNVGLVHGRVGAAQDVVRVSDQRCAAVVQMLMLMPAQVVQRQIQIRVDALLQG